MFYYALFVVVFGLFWPCAERGYAGSFSVRISSFLTYLKRGRFFTTLLLAGSVGASAWAVDSSEKVYNAQTVTLENGLRVVVVENHLMPVVNHMIWYEVGAADEPPGKSGLAHLLEHAMFKGTTSIGPGEFSRVIAENGGNLNAFTSSDFTAYYVSIAADRLPLVMEMEADRMRNLVCSEQDFLTERDVVVQERLQRTENNPDAQLDERVNVSLWVTHPYRNPVVGWMNEVSSLTRQDAFDFYKSWYSPEKAIVIITGDVKTSEAMKLAQRYYGSLPGKKYQKRVRPTSVLAKANTRVDMSHPNVRTPRWMQTYRVPSVRTAASPREVAALEVLTEVLGGGSLGLLYRDLVIERRIAVDAGASYRAFQVDDTYLQIYAIPKDGVSVEELEKTTLEFLDRFLREGVSAGDVEEAKIRLRAGVIYERDSLIGPAYMIGQALVVGEPLSSVETWPQQIAVVSREDVMDAAQRWVHVSDSVIGVLRPQGDS